MVTYEVADNNLALSVTTGSLGGCLFGGSGTRLLQFLLDTTDRRSGGGTTGRTALASATTASSITLGRENLVERLVELSRHGDLSWTCS